MLYTYPDYYKEFHCTADKCEDTCCAGWQIVIDKKSLANYKKVRGPFRWEMFKSVNWLNGTFRQDKEKRCAFLNEKNLCNLYIHQGEGSLCKTCRLYPRHIEEFEGLREISLSVSCPEAAKILMNRMEPVRFLTYEKDRDEEYEDFDPFLFSILEDAREEMLHILQNRELPIKVRVFLILAMAHDMQGRINRQELFSCGDVIEKYKSQAARIFAEKEIADSKNLKKAGKLAKELFGKLYELELLKEDWKMVLDETEILLYQDEKYSEKCEQFAQWKKEHSEMEIHLEQLLVYFLFTYFLGAVYDGEVFAKVQMAVYLTWMIHEIWMARWLENEGSLERDEMTELLYRFSREVEHSDINLKQVEKWMEKKWMF